MDNKKFNFWSRVVSGIVFVIAAFTYVSTIEPTASFWDCGEFIASSYKLEVGHPPGNPVFQLIARVFTMFAGAEHAAIAVNVMSALCSALTIFFLFLTIVFFAKRLVKPLSDGTYSVGQSISILGGAAVGALAYTFSDTFWFSAVEGEVYAMSSLFTAIVFWAMTKWYEQADSPYANRWIILICFLMGLSIGVHLLNLLAIPALMFLYFYKRRENGTYTFWEFVKIFLFSVVVLGLLVFIIIPWLPKVAAYFDLFFVNVLGCSYNVGTAFFMIALLALCFWGAFATYKKGKYLWNSVIVGFTTIVIGFSLFTIVIIRSNAKTPTNEYQPDNAFTLVRYLSREQYGSTPLLYGQYFGAPASIKTGKYWAPVDGKYKHVNSPSDAEYDASGKMLFPRMWNGLDPRYVDFYESYMQGKGHPVAGAEHKKPTFGTNLYFFFDFQLNWMYWRYFMWNFAGRQNDIHSPSPGEPFYGNWESGIKPLDEFRLGDQSNAPAILSENKGKNHYFLLPLLLGLIGLFFQYDRDKRGCWVTFLLFFMTGIAIVIYLNQPPYQVRERDYAYAGSFYAFSIWIGFAVVALYEWLCSKKSSSTALASALTVLCLGVPALMAAQNWDDHDRSNRKTSIEVATNYLNSTGEQGILITHGDNDTFPLWYAQEVEGIRTDVRICNTSLLGTDWHIEQMKYACNESKPLPISISQDQYLYGTNDYVPIFDKRNQVVPIADVMAVFKHQEAKLQLQDGRMIDYIISRKISVPVNKDNAIASGIVPKELADSVKDHIVLEIPKGKDYITKQELFMLDLLSGYQWDRPINLLTQGGDINIGIKNFLMYDGFSCRLVPFRNKVSTSDLGLVDADDLYNKVMNVFKWDALSRLDYDVDYQNLYTFLGVLPQREVFSNVADVLIARGDTLKAINVLDKCQQSVPAQQYPLESMIIGFYSNDLSVVTMIDAYYRAGAPEKGRDLAKRFSDELLASTRFFIDWYPGTEADLKRSYSVLQYLMDILNMNGDKELADELMASVEKLLK